MKTIKGFQDTRSVIKAIYLDWVNNWLTLQAMADHYEMEKDRLDRIIHIGRNLMRRNHHSKAENNRMVKTSAL